MSGFEARVALVTGAGSETGIGFACARALGREGATVGVAATTERIHERAAELRRGRDRRRGVRRGPHQSRGQTALVAAVLERFGRDSTCS